nr:KilA-N domain-containing protein [uncultured Rhodopila sp.]
MIPPSDTEADRPPASLTYEGKPIQRRGEFLNLTSMWFAMARPPNGHPTDWLRLPETRRFLRHLSSRIDDAPVMDCTDGADLSGLIGVDTDDLVLKTRGRKGGTWAHWQLGLIYARYLSPAFHLWCNRILRDGIERLGGGSPPSAAGLLAGYLDQEFGRLHGRLDIADRHAADLMFLVTATQVLTLGNRRAFSGRSQVILRQVVASAPFAGRCPCCHDTEILSPDGRAIDRAELDHFFNRALNRPEHGWLICRQCHEDFNRGGYLVRFSKLAEFRRFQAAVFTFTLAQRRSTRTCSDAQ